MNITEELILKFSSKPAFQRGKQSYLRGAVHVEESSEWYIRATVKSSHSYTVELYDRGDGEYETSCNCPFEWGGDCAHIVAASFAAMEELRSISIQKGEEQLVNLPPQSQELKDSWKTIVAALVPPGQVSGRLKVKTGSVPVIYGLEISGNERRLYALRFLTKKDGKPVSASILGESRLAELASFDLTDRILIPHLGFGFSISIEDESSYACDTHSTDSPKRYYWSGTHQRFNDLLILLNEKELYLLKEGPEIIRRLYVMKETTQFFLQLDETTNGLELSPYVLFNQKALKITPEHIVLANEPLWLFISDNLVRVEGINGHELKTIFELHPHPIIKKNEREQFLQEGLPILLKKYKIQTQLDIIQFVEMDPLPCLYLREEQSALSIELRFQYNDFEVYAHHPMGEDDFSEAECFIRDGKIVRITRNLIKENESFTKLESSSLKLSIQPGVGVYFSPTIQPLEWLLSILPFLQQEGFRIFGQENLVRNKLSYAKPTLSVYVSSGIDWFDLEAKVSFDGTTADFEAIEAALKKNEKFIQLKDGSYGLLPDMWVKRFKTAFSIASLKSHKIRFARAQFGLVQELIETADEATYDKNFSELGKRFASFSAIKRKSLSEQFNGTLRQYQLYGYEWLYFLREFRFGGILADDMGLGKTVQTLALLQKVYEEGAEHPTLIIVPTSLIFNWQNEAKRFTPNLRVLCYRGLDRRDHLEVLNEFHLLITSYGILRRDIEVLRELYFEYIVLDESQNIKNFESVSAKASRLLRSEYRLALTGTPVENNLLELWSQFAFINPGILGKVNNFIDQFARPIERLQDEPASKTLQKMVFPFILRRTKELVESDLPSKQESIVICEMEQPQQILYNQWKEYFRSTILRRIDEKGIRSSKLLVLEGLMRLRQICCHPQLVDSEYAGPIAKYDAFIEMLEDVLAEGHKVLVFSQFVKMLKILRKYCDDKKVPYEYLDGHTIDREKRVQNFQTNDSIKIFLISLKAGGTGLNLTAADYVFIYDPWWNPAVEMQATDRTHRIGQTKKVFAYKLITKETVEEKILELQERKKSLVEHIISTDEEFFKKLTKEDVIGLFS